VTARPRYGAHMEMGEAVRGVLALVAAGLLIIAARFRFHRRGNEGTTDANDLGLD